MTSADDAAAAQAARRAGDRLAKTMARLAAQAKAARPTGFRVPELDEDPELDDPTNAWILTDGRLRIRTSDGVIHEFADVASPGPATSTTVRPADPDLTSYRKVYRADWAQIHCTKHGVETGDYLHYGRVDDVHGEQRVMIGFNDELIRADLAGAAVKKVELRALNTHAWASTGLNLHWGTHNRDEPPLDFTATRSDVYTGWWPRSGWGGNKEGWRTIPTWCGNALRDNQIKGLVIDQPGGVTSYGEINWSTVELAVSYVK